MKLTFKEISIRNFLSFGNVSQTIKLNDKPYQIITGQNKDKSDNEEDKNGVGKSTIQQAIHYALFGKSTGNKVNLGYLINNINGKNMVVSLTFEKDGVEYKITRGRSPNILQLLKNGEEVVQDESQGDSRETQKEIERIIGFGDELYNQLFNLTCQVPLFLEQNTASQKSILEKILGVDVISKKIVALKELIKETKNNLNNELFKYNTIKTQNENLTNSINKQIEDMNIAKKEWLANIQNNIVSDKTALSQLQQIDIEKEIENFKLIEEYRKLQGVNTLNQQLKDSILREMKSIQTVIDYQQSLIDKYKDVDFDKELEKFLYNKEVDVKSLEIQQKKQELSNILLEIKQLEDNKQLLMNKIADVNNKINSFKENRCPTCGSVLNKEESETSLKQLSEELNSLDNDLKILDNQILDKKDLLTVYNNYDFNILEKVPCILMSESDGERIKQEILDHTKIIEENKQKLKENQTKFDEIVIVDVPTVYPVTYYKTIDQAMNHKVTVQTLENNLKQYEDTLKTNPFEQQEKSIEEMRQNILELDDSAVKGLEDDLLHQETLLKLLNNPSSFIRKTILDKSLEFLNNRVAKYLSMVGSMHSVVFNNDMSIEFYKMGVKYGYISSGEEGRVSMALTFAFRDVWESLNNCDVNLLFFDEVIDRLGLDEAGVDLLIDMIKQKNNKNTLLVTHNSKLIGQTNDIIKLVKENDFTRVV